MSDFEKCKTGLDDFNVNYFTRELENGNIQLVHYEPYCVYDSETGEVKPVCYAYYWCDTYDSEGNFIIHEVYESTFSYTLDTSI